MKKFKLSQLDLTNEKNLNRQEMKTVLGGKDTFGCPEHQNPYICQPCGTPICASSSSEAVYKCLAIDSNCYPGPYQS